MRRRYTQDCTARTANDEASVVYLTLSVDGDLDDVRHGAIEDAVRREGGRAFWRSSAAAGRSYALLELPDRYDVGTIGAAVVGSVYEEPIIALALFPAVAEALPPLREALGGAGRPAGVRACRPCPHGLILEWNPSISSAEVVMGVIDVELRRWQSGRTAEVLSPLPPSVVAMVAASGLQAPQITVQRTLERSSDCA